jgi:hypothetical protein
MLLTWKQQSNVLSDFRCYLFFTIGLLEWGSKHGPRIGSGSLPLTSLIIESLLDFFSNEPQPKHTSPFSTYKPLLRLCSAPRRSSAPHANTKVHLKYQLAHEVLLIATSPSPKHKALYRVYPPSTSLSCN